MKQAEADYANFSRLKEESFNLAQQLRGVAQVILKRQAHQNECPLCHTRFEPGELAKHIHQGVDTTLDQTAQQLIEQKLNAQDMLSRAQAIRKNVAQLADQKALSDGSVRGIFDGLLNCERDLAELLTIATDLDAKMEALDAQGVSYPRLLALNNELAALGSLLSDLNLNTISNLAAFYMKESAARLTDLESLAVKEAQCLASLKAHIPASQTSVNGRGWLSRYKEQISVTESVVARIVPFSEPFPWPMDAPLSEYLMSISSVRSLADELLSARNLEAHNAAMHAEASTRKQDLQKQIDDIQPRADRLKDSYSALSLLIDQFPLTGAMEKALEANKAAIESIFSRIHAPAEFSGLGSEFSTLRRNSGDEAKLTEVSTGQRAALALSIFLAQNNQLASGPPVVLIDDPIAHVDDLNCLSFLDYLREMVLEKRRQIFFATANEKIASLIQRKFDFLGEEFKRIQLTRHS